MQVPDRPAPEPEAPKAVAPKAEDMPEWWDPAQPPQKLKDGYIYRGKDGRWYRPNGVIVNRRDRRAAKVK